MRLIRTENRMLDDQIMPAKTAFQCKVISQNAGLMDREIMIMITADCKTNR